MGNTVVLKGPEKAPGCYWTLVDIFNKAGFPPGVLNSVIHRPQDGPEIIPGLIEAPAVKKINFTGSTATGRIIASLAGKQLKPVLMELGGKAPAIICEDADLGLAALQCALGAFLYSGQICMATERILVNAKVADKFRETLAATVDQVFPDKNGLVLVDKAPVVKNAKMLQDAIAKGAKAVYGDVEDKRELATAMRPVILVSTYVSLQYSLLTPWVGGSETRSGSLLHRILWSNSLALRRGIRRRSYQDRQRYRIRSSFCGIHRELATRFPHRETDRGWSCTHQLNECT